MKKIVLLGPPGCGKGTQSKLLVEKNNFVQLSTGDLLRLETSNSDSDLGKKVKYLMESGELVPDGIVIDIIVNKVEEHKNKSIVFDGFPRNLKQAEVLDSSLENVSVKLDHAILFQIDFKILEERINNRISETKGSEQRKDDNSETLLNRIEVFKSSTLPIVKYYEEKGIISKIDGMQKVNEVYAEITKIIC
mgnify:FL=1